MTTFVWFQSLTTNYMSTLVWFQLCTEAERIKNKEKLQVQFSQVLFSCK